MSEIQELFHENQTTIAIQLKIDCSVLLYIVKVNTQTHEKANGKKN